MEFDQAKIDAAVAKYKAEKAQRDQKNAEAEAQLAQEKTIREAFYADKSEKQRLSEIHTAAKDYKCECCGKPIEAGTQYRRQNIPTGYGIPEGTHYTPRITHTVCTIEGGTPK